MASTETPTTSKKVAVKEMSWDPITRIVGSLGIHTEIDFDAKKVEKCYSTSMIFRGFDIFMKGIDPRDTHFITSRICGICGDNHCTTSCLNQNMAYGVKPPALGDLGYNLAETADYMFDHAIFNDCMANVDFCEQMVKETNPSLLQKAEQTAAPGQDVHGYKTIADIMRALNPFTGDFYLETPPGGPLHEGDVLPVRRAPHPPVDDHARRGLGRHHAPDLHGLLRAADALHRLRQAGGADARRPLRLLPSGVAGVRHGRLPRDGPRLLGLFRRPRLRRLRLPEHDRVGPEALHHPGRGARWRADHDGPGRDQPDDQDPPRQLVLRRLDERGDVRHAGSARQPGGQAPPVEQGHPAEAAEARLPGQVQLGGVTADL